MTSAKSDCWACICVNTRNERIKTKIDLEGLDKGERYGEIEGKIKIKR